MRRISSIRNCREADLEARREELRDVRWARRRSQMITITLILIAIITAGMLWASQDPAGLVHLLGSLGPGSG
jgi:hypothetical protein